MYGVIVVWLPPDLLPLLVCRFLYPFRRTFALVVAGCRCLSGCRFAGCYVPHVALRRVRQPLLSAPSCSRRFALFVRCACCFSCGVCCGQSGSGCFVQPNPQAVVEVCFQFLLPVIRAFRRGESKGTSPLQGTAPAGHTAQAGRKTQRSEDGIMNQIQETDDKNKTETCTFD